MDFAKFVVFKLKKKVGDVKWPITLIMGSKHENKSKQPQSFV